jgi:hypothetical protein
VLFMLGRTLSRKMATRMATAALARIQFQQVRTRKMLEYVAASLKLRGVPMAAVCEMSVTALLNITGGMHENNFRSTRIFSEMSGFPSLSVM